MDLEAVSEFEETQEEHSQGICSISKHMVVTTDTVKLRYGPDVLNTTIRVRGASQGTYKCLDLGLDDSDFDYSSVLADIKTTMSTICNPNVSVMTKSPYDRKRLLYRTMRTGWTT
jgi:hypothetical protein